MNSSTLTELALRSAVTTSSKDASATATQPENIKTNALQRANVLVGGNSNVSNMTTEMGLQEAAIGLAIKGIELSCVAVAHQLEQVKNKRLSFDKERQAGIATFIVPTDKEELKLSKQEYVIKAFIDLIDSNPEFKPYLGINAGELKDAKDAKFYSVLPFYRMSDALEQPVASPNALDKQRIAIGLFFRSALPEAIADIDNDFQDTNKVKEFFESAFKKENYLNDSRAPRFIIMSLANLLWNLQHPVDPASGFPLGTNETIEICKKVGQFLNLLLNKDGKYGVHELNNSNNELLTYVRRVETHTKALRAAYTEQQLYELNVNDLTNSAHRTLRIMDKSLFELLYTRKNPTTKKDEPDSKAAERLTDIISYLNQLVSDNENLLTYFQPYAELIKGTPFSNPSPVTIIDVLILFSHCSNHDKKGIIKALNKSTNDYNKEFATHLDKFNTQYLQPIRKICKEEVKRKSSRKLDPKRSSVEANTLAARRLIPLITLVIEDFRIEVDTTKSRELAKSSEGKTNECNYLCAKNQATAINKLALVGNGYYELKISPFVELAAKTEEELDKLPKHQYRFTELTKLLDSVSEIVQNYRSFLQLKTFQDFLIRCLENVKKEYSALETHIEEVDSCLRHDQSINRNLQSTLSPMTKGLTSSLAAFSAAASNFEHVVTSPDFTEQQKQLLSSKLETIHQQYFTLFNEKSGILNLVPRSSEKTTDSDSKERHKSTTHRHHRKSVPVPSDHNNSETHSSKTSRHSKHLSQEVPDPQPPTVPQASEPKQAPEAPKKLMSSKQVLALRNLAMECFQGLSYQSKISDKGALLKHLIALIDANEHFSEQQFHQSIKELAKISLSYRTTFFFQASYGQTRAAKVFIAALKNQELNATLPLASVLLQPNHEPWQFTDSELVAQLRGLAKGNEWQQDAHQLVKLEAL